MIQSRERLRLLLIETPAGHRRAVVELYVRELETHARDLALPMTRDRAVDVARNNLGYATGDGVPLELRRAWRDEAGIVHPVLPELAERDLCWADIKAAIERWFAQEIER